MAIVRVGLVEDRVSLDDLAEEFASAAAGRGAGSLVIFMGFVKGVVDGKKVYRLSYEAVEELALRKLREIAEEAASRPGVEAIAVYHRLGSLEPGEPTIYVAVVAEPRQLAFSLAAEVLDRVKKEVPVYKLEVREDGEYWILGHERIRREAGQA